MRSDIGGTSLLIAHIPRRRARGRLFTDSGRHLLLLTLAAAASLAALSMLADQSLFFPSVPVGGQVR